MGEQPKPTLEQYTGFFMNDDRRGLTLDLLNQIVKMHGFCGFRTKKALVPAIRQAALMSPTRSTLRGGGAHPCAALGLDEVKRDVAAIGWAECPLGSIQTVGSTSGAAACASASFAEPILFASPTAVAAKNKKRKRRTALISIWDDADRPMIGAKDKKKNKKKKKKKKKKLALGAPLLLIDGCPPLWDPPGM